MAELFNMMSISFRKGDNLFIEKAMDLMITRVRPEFKASLPSVVSNFLEDVFDPERVPDKLSSHAASLGISENYLSRMVKSSTGRSVGEWIDISRIGRAKRMLSETELPVIDIASSIGIEDQSYFARFFKKETGMTPSSYRKIMQGKS